jgi:hypothetical protein
MHAKAVAAGVAGAGAAGFFAARALRRDDSSDELTEAGTNTGELKKHLGDLIALDRHLMGVLERQAESSELESYPAARGIINSILTTTASHIASLEGCAEELGGLGGSGLKSAVTAVTGAVTGMFDRQRSEPVSRMLRDDYTALALCAMSNGMLHTAALGMGEHRIANLAQRHVGEIPPLMSQIMREMPGIVLEEMSNEGMPVDTNVRQQARDAMEQAWAT